LPAHISGERGKHRTAALNSGVALSLLITGSSGIGSAQWQSVAACALRAARNAALLVKMACKT